MMPKYQVLQPIEKNNVLYVAAGASMPKLVPSACHGKLIPVNTAGEIELSEEEAAHLTSGQVPLFQGKPDPIGGAKERGKKAKEEAEAAAARSAAERAEYQEFVAYRAAKMKKSESGN